MSTSPSISETSASASTSEVDASETSALLPMLEPPTSSSIREASTSPSVSERPTSPSTSEAFASPLNDEPSTPPPISDPAFVHETSSSLYSTSPPLSSTSISPPLLTPTDSYSPPWTSSASHSRTSSSTSSSWASASSSSSGSTSANSVSASFIPSPPPAPPHNYILEITLCPHLIRNPTVSRTLSLPAHTSFATLHAAIQLSFGWTFAYPWSFSIGEEEEEDDADDLPDDFDSDNPDKADNDDANDADPDKQDKQHHHRGPLLHLLPTPLYPRSLYPRLPPHTHWASSLSLSTIYTNPTLGSAPLTYLYDPQHARWTHTIILVGLSPPPSPPPPPSPSLHPQSPPHHLHPPTPPRLDPSARITCITGTGRPPPDSCPGPVLWEYLKRAYRSREEERRWRVRGLVTAEEEKWMGWYERECEGEGREGRRGLGGMRAEEWDVRFVRGVLCGLEVRGVGEG